MPASPNQAGSTPQEITIDEPADLTFRTNQSQISELATGSATSSSSSKPRSIQSRVLKKLASTFSLTVGTTDEDDEIKFLSERSATCILVNFISVGYILLPSAFAQGGTILAPLCLIFISVQSWITGTYVLEACARAEALKASITHSRHVQLSLHSSRMDELASSKRSSSRSFAFRNNLSKHSESRSRVSFEIQAQQPQSEDTLAALPSPKIQDREKAQEHDDFHSTHDLSKDSGSRVSFEFQLQSEKKDTDSSRPPDHRESEDRPDTHVNDQYKNTPANTPRESGSISAENTKEDNTSPTNVEDMQSARNPLHEPERKVPKRHLPSSSYSFRIHDRTYELSELCRIFLGRGLRNLFTFTTCGDLYGITWAFAAIFGSSLADDFPMGTDFDYQLYILIFSFITIPVSCMRIVAQVTFQYVFLVGRTLMISLMMGTLIASYVSKESHFGSPLLEERKRDIPLAIFSSIVTVLQFCVFSTAFQFSIPGLTAETGDKRAMKSIISRSVCYIYVTNLVLGLTMSIYFGQDTESSSNLNWLNYHGGTWDGVGDFSSAWWARCISSYIVIFAALDGLAVYPLIAISLGDLLMAAKYEDNVHFMQEDWKIRLTFRLIAAIPQAVGSLFVKDLGVIAKYAGIFTLLSYTICPSYLAIRSRRVVEDVDLPSDTRYKTFCSSDRVAWALICLSVALIIGVIVDAAREGS